MRSALPLRTTLLLLCGSVVGLTLAGCDSGDPGGQSSAGDLPAVSEWDEAFEERARWWSFQPIVASSALAGDDRDPIDALILRELEARGKLEIGE